MVLTDYDAVRLRQLAGQVSHAVEATCRQVEPGNTECEILGHLAHRLLRHDIEPLTVHVFADNRAQDFACPRPRILRVENSCTILVTARSRGLHVTTSRTICFKKVPEEFRERYRVAAIASATLLRFSQADESASNLIQRAKRMYQKHGFEFCWRDAALGGHAGYVYRCFPMTPHTKGKLKANTAIAWAPQVNGVTNADTVLVKQDQQEILSYHEDWPVIGVSIRDQTIDRPDILVR
jgi:Xaa-Pro dipeptidase